MSKNYNSKNTHYSTESYGGRVKPGQSSWHSSGHIVKTNNDCGNSFSKPQSPFSTEGLNYKIVDVKID